MLSKDFKQDQPSNPSFENGQQVSNKMIGDEIHKVPENIRRALKVGMYRKNMSFNARNNYSERNFMTQVSNELQTNNKQFSAKHMIMPNKRFLEEGKQIMKQTAMGQQSFHFYNEVTRFRSSQDKLLYAKKKLSPLKKGISVQPRALLTREKKNFKVTFLNIEKLKLVKMYDRPEKDKIEQKANNLALIDRKSQLEIDPSQNSANQIISRSTLYNKSPIKMRIKPFRPPYERYYYRDFIWKCAFSNNIFHESPEVYEQKFKVFVGKGNNSMLIKSLMKRRKCWWNFTDHYQEANLIWTQIKSDLVFTRQKNQLPFSQCKQVMCPQTLFSNPSKQLTKNNLKILSSHQYEHWQDYFNKFRKAEDTLTETMKKRNKFFSVQSQRLTCKSLLKVDLKSIKIHNHLPNNYIISNKKALFYTMSKYYERTMENIFEHLPLTFHVQNGLQDQEYLKFLNYYYERAKKIRARDKNTEEGKEQIILESPESSSRISVQNMWIVKPGQFTNRGNGIIVCMNLQQIKTILKKKQRHDNGNLKTYIIQSYIQKPFLYQKRKFDIRHYMMITSINGTIKGYWYQLGYIRTTSFEYSIKNSLSSVHLTNDAVQKYLPEYGKYQKGNKLSYSDFQKYLDKEYGNGAYCFEGQVYPKMKKIATDSIKACSLMIDPQKKGHNFQIFGMDFMIDGDFHPWLIEINNNPCLELSCPLLQEIIPPMVENALRICIDSLIPPPANFLQKKPKFNDNAIALNKFEVVYNSACEEKHIKDLFNGTNCLDLDYAELEKDQDELFDDDGLELDD